MTQRHIFWPQDRTFSVSTLNQELVQAGLDPETTEIFIDVDQDQDGMVTGIKFHCTDDGATKR